MKYNALISLTVARYERIRHTITESTCSTPTINTDPRDEDALTYIADAYKSALCIYLHIILDEMTKATEDNANSIAYSNIHSLISITKDEAISACIQQTSLVLDEDPCVVGLVPLLFIVASETKISSEFELACIRLSTIFKSACLGNVGTTLELLQKMQRITSVHWRQILKICEWDLLVT